MLKTAERVKEKWESALGETGTQTWSIIILFPLLLHCELIFLYFCFMFFFFIWNFDQAAGCGNTYLIFVFCIIIFILLCGFMFSNIMLFLFLIDSAKNAVTCICCVEVFYFIFNITNRKSYWKESGVSNKWKICQITIFIILNFYQIIEFCVLVITR